MDELKQEIKYPTFGGTPAARTLEKILLKEEYKKYFGKVGVILSKYNTNLNAFYRAAYIFNIETDSYFGAMLSERNRVLNEINKSFDDSLEFKSYLVNVIHAGYKIRYRIFRGITKYSDCPETIQFGSRKWELNQLLEAEIKKEVIDIGESKREAELKKQIRILADEIKELKKKLDTPPKP